MAWHGMAWHGMVLKVFGHAIGLALVFGMDFGFEIFLLSLVREVMCCGTSNC